jgi:DNA-binding MarR family transcriptional regulator
MINGPDEIYSNYSFLLERTGKKIRQFARQKFRAYGFLVTIDQWAVLKALHEEAPLSQVDLAQRCHKDTPTVTRILDLLVEKKLVSRHADHQDRRRQQVALTAAGKVLVHEMLPQVQEIRMHAWENLSDDDFKHFVRILNTIYTNLDR